MKKGLLLYLLLLVFASRAQQISITAEDMPQEGDTLRVSLASPNTTLDYSATGPNHTWDFSALRPVAQRLERYVNVNSTPLFYQLAFSSPLVTNKATIASPVGIPDNLRELAGENLQNFTIEDIILFFRQTPTEFQELGFGATLNGLSVPVQYEQPDVHYRFPVEYSQLDSSLSNLKLNYAAQSIYFAQYRKRVNHADGWGSLTTPFGTFSVLRVVSTIYVTDTLKTGETPGVRTVRPTVREYKWLGKEQGIPLLQVNTAEVNGQEVILSITYRDLFRRLDPLLSSPEELAATSFRVYPSPLGAADALTLELPAQREPTHVTLISPTGQVLYRQRIDPSAENRFRVPAAAFSPARGLYLMRIESGNSLVVRKIMRD